jgi:sialidase-1
MRNNDKRLRATHGVVCHRPDERLGYFGWPSLARMDDGALAVVSSGLRQWHICPWGKTVLNISRDDGATWSAPRVIRDTPIDDRDAGVISLGGRRLLAATFSSDPRPFADEPAAARGMADTWRPHLATLTDAIVQPHMGSWVLLSDDGGDTWSAPVSAPASAPHGPVRLRNGDLLYLGKDARDLSAASIIAAHSIDDGRTWRTLCELPVHPATIAANYHEPHVVELPNGRLIGLIRLENAGQSDVTQAGLVNFSMLQTTSDDGGNSWTVPQPARDALGHPFHGSPPHLIRHASGALICVYSFRQHPYGQRAMLSWDDGLSWSTDWIIRDDGPSWDLGYPASVELGDGSVLTVYYQQVRAAEPCAILWSRWQVPARLA